MVKTITKFIRLGLKQELWETIRVEAKRRGVSVNALIRTAVEQHLAKSSLWRTATRPNNVDLLNTPLVTWTREEKEYADKVLEEHFAEDRNEIIRFNEPRRH